MRKWKTVFWTIIFVCALPAVMYGEEPESAEQNSKERPSGIVSGLVNTVTNTVSNTGEAVKQTVEATGKTLKQTVDFTEETVKTIAETPAEKPVTKTVERTADFVRQTVKTVQPAVSKTTETVQQTVEDTAEVSKAVPEVPVVTPVAKEAVHAVSETVDHTAGYVNETSEAVTSNEPDKPLRQVLENTGELVNETVASTVQVVETVTESVETVTNEVTKAVNELPVASNAVPVVEETVTFATSTVNRTAETVNKTVQNVTNPAKQPIRQTVKDTAAFIGETVSSTVPIVEKTTAMVTGTVQEVTQTTEVLPKIPVVTPVIDEVTNLVNGSVDTVKEVTDQTVTETVGKTNEVLRPAVQSPQITTVEKPVVTKPDANKDKVDSAENAVQLPMLPLQDPAVQLKKDTEKLVNEIPEELVKEETSEKVAYEILWKRQKAFEPFTEQQERAPVYSDSSFGVALPEWNAEVQEDQVTPPVKENHNAVAESPAVFVTTGSSTVTSAANGSHIDMTAGLWNEQLQAIRTVSKRWYVEHILGKVQWTHPPPGQPPKNTPFLYVSI